MRFPSNLLVLAGALACSGCATVDLITNQCDTEYIRVTWPATITRGSLTVTTTLQGAVTPGNIDATQFRNLKDALIDGDGNATNVVWTVDAFNVNGGYIALMHSAPATSGQTEAVSLAFDGGGWGTIASPRPFAPTIALRAENFNATSATGSITTVDPKPLKLRVDVTTSNAAGETIKVTGDAQFRYERVSSSCS